MKQWILTGTLVGAALLAACGSEKKPQEAETTVPVRVLVVNPVAGVASDTYVGTVEEKSGTMLSFEVAGSIRTLSVDAGQKVHRGQVLAVLDETTLKQAYEAARATLKQAEDAARRFEPLHAQGTITDLQWVEVQTKLDQAKAAEGIARKQLAHCVLRAPFSGVVSSRSADPGMTVLPGQPVMKLVTIDHVQVKISVPEKEIPQIRTGQEARFTVPALGGAAFGGKVTEKGIAANPLSHTYEVKISLPNPQGQLLPGMVCSVSLDEREAGTTQLVIPASAVQLDTDGRRFVWIVKDGTASCRFIEAGRLTGEDSVVISSGLKPGDRVITSGAQKVSDGMKVKVQP